MAKCVFRPSKRVSMAGKQRAGKKQASHIIRSRPQVGILFQSTRLADSNNVHQE